MSDNVGYATQQVRLTTLPKRFSHLARLVRAHGKRVTKPGESPHDPPPKNAAPPFPDALKDNARVGPGSMLRAHLARRRPPIHLLAVRATRTRHLQNEGQLTSPRTLPIARSSQPKPSINLRSGWLGGTLFAAALAFVTTAPVLAATDDIKATNFLLDNGMEVVVIPDHRAPIVTHMVWYKIGSADEPPGKSGIAHFFEHLMFKATANHAAGEFEPRGRPRSAARTTPSPITTIPPFTKQ